MESNKEIIEKKENININININESDKLDSNTSNTVSGDHNVNNENDDHNKTSSNHSQWILYIIIIGLSGYLITKNSDPINIVFTLSGCIITIFILQKMINRKIYKLEDDDDGVNLIEG